MNFPALQQADINAWLASELSLPNLLASHAILNFFYNRQYLLKDLQKTTCFEAKSCL